MNPNSYNFRLFDTLLIAIDNKHGGQNLEKITLSAAGFVLQPNKLYLAATHETIGSTKYVTTLLGRSSIGRLGLFLNITADLGHVGAVSQWTLELTVVQPLRIYPSMRIGQVAFWKQMGRIENYCGRYHKDTEPVPNRDFSIISAL